MESPATGGYCLVALCDIPPGAILFTVNGLIQTRRSLEKMYGDEEVARNVLAIAGTDLVINSSIPGFRDYSAFLDTSENEADHNVYYLVHTKDGAMNVVVRVKLDRGIKMGSKLVISYGEDFPDVNGDRHIPITNQAMHEIILPRPASRVGGAKNRVGIGLCFTIGILQNFPDGCSYTSILKFIEDHAERYKRIVVHTPTPGDVRIECRTGVLRVVRQALRIIMRVVHHYLVTYVSESGLFSLTTLGKQFDASTFKPVLLPQYVSK